MVALASDFPSTRPSNEEIGCDLANVGQSSNQQQQQTMLVQNDDQSRSPPLEGCERHGGGSDDCSVTSIVHPTDTDTAGETVPSTRTSAVKDAVVGIVIEAGVKHFDRSNRRHPERPSRVTSIVQALTDRGLLQRCRRLDLDEDTSTENLLQEKYYLRVHLAGYMQRLQKLSTCTCTNRLDCEAAQYQSVYLTPDSVHEARRAASAVCRLVEHVLDSHGHDSRDIMHGFALVRPPGHHAEPGLAGGYCLVNNVALAAAWALQKSRSDNRHIDIDGTKQLGEEPRQRQSVRRVCIVDWDVHHGNGTQSIFYSNPSVLYFSVHLYLSGTFYPHSGRHDAVGSGDGTGTTVNVAWSSAGMGDEEYLAVWEALLLPMLQEFDPDLVLVSAGFDAARGDIGDCRLTPHGFATMTHRIKATLEATAKAKAKADANVSAASAAAPIVCTLEGGYAQSTLGQCVAAVVEALLEKAPNLDNNDDDASSRIALDDIHPSAAHNIRQTIETQRPYWKFLQRG